MKNALRTSAFSLRTSTGVISALVLGAALAGCAGYGMQDATAAGGKLMLQGSNEVPPVSTNATGSGTITVAADHSVSGSITTMGMNGTAAHIHSGAAGTSGPVIVPLVKSGENSWMVPPGAKLTDAQYAAYMAGGTYVNVHSAAHPAGEIRAQLSAK